ncbi:uncharacterized protein EV422DRAFT_546195 [Fimicolochytrium jonesii]|uniref:uncharacterized protein n=1 Tax=Fimicolochytrium jonesii TaxID=1396493 RepID=UPI0022FDDB88|nr:uncharacterized protein EV422DRAFT_546195 [Fimicolochytrium jonesii]KAI8816298.1 hypothetical protein EV422DRAFT_546195 [Fimicolochytrium jonesii]
MSGLSIQMEGLRRQGRRQSPHFLFELDDVVFDPDEVVAEDIQPIFRNMPIDDIYHTVEEEAEALEENFSQSESDGEEGPSEVEETGISKQAEMPAEPASSVHASLKYLYAAVNKLAPPGRLDDIKRLLDEVRPTKSKWASDNIGQEKLYFALEKVLTDLKAYEAHSTPFLHPVDEKLAPDYYTLIKHPMDLGTMTVKLEQHKYESKDEFISDLNLIWNNCHTYNVHPPDNIYRKRASAMRRKSTDLMKKVPDIKIIKLSSDEHDSGDEEATEQGDVTIERPSAEPEDNTPFEQDCLDDKAQDGLSLSPPPSETVALAVPAEASLPREPLLESIVEVASEPEKAKEKKIKSVKDEKWKKVVAPHVREQAAKRAGLRHRKFEDMPAIVPDPDALAQSLYDEQSFIRKSKTYARPFSEPVGFVNKFGPNGLDLAPLPLTGPNILKHVRKHQVVVPVPVTRPREQELDNNAEARVGRTFPTSSLKRRSEEGATEHTAKKVRFTDPASGDTRFAGDGTSEDSPKRKQDDSDGGEGRAKRQKVVHVPITPDDYQWHASDNQASPDSDDDTEDSESPDVPYNIEDDFIWEYEGSFFPERNFPGGTYPGISQKPLVIGKQMIEPDVLFEDPGELYARLPSLSDFPEVTEPDKGILNNRIDKNIKELKRVKVLHAKIQSHESGQPPDPPKPSIPKYHPPTDLSEHPSFQLNSEAAADIAKQAVAKLLMHTGFDTTTDKALSTLTDLFTEHLCNLGKTIALYTEQFGKLKSDEEILGHVLQENGVARAGVLHSYVHDVERHGPRLRTLRKKMDYAYKDATKPKQKGPADYDVEAATDDFVSGNFLGGDLDMLNLKELGIEGVTSIPRELWRKMVKKRRTYKAKIKRKIVHKVEEPAVKHKRLTNFPDIEAWKPVDPEKVIGLLKPFYHERVESGKMEEDTPSVRLNAKEAVAQQPVGPTVKKDDLNQPYAKRMVLYAKEGRAKRPAPTSQPAAVAAATKSSAAPMAAASSSGAKRKRGAAEMAAAKAAKEEEKIRKAAQKQAEKEEKQRLKEQAAKEKKEKQAAARAAKRKKS